MRKNWEKDVRRYYGSDTPPGYISLVVPEIQWLKIFRNAQRARSPILVIYWKLRLLHLQRTLNISISPATRIGEGFYIGHTGRIIISKLAELGRNINIATGVTIGQENRGRRKGAPRIGDEVWIGTNAVIVGKITIGSDVLIAPGAFVNFDVPSHSIVVGNPGRIIPSPHATEGYIHNKV